MLHERPERETKTTPVVRKSRSDSVGSESPRDGLRFVRRLTKPEIHPYDEIEWELRDAVITNERGEVKLPLLDTAWLAEDEIYSQYVLSESGRLDDVAAHVAAMVRRRTRAITAVRRAVNVPRY